MPGRRLRIAGLEYDPSDRSFTRRGERLPLVGKPLELVEYFLTRGNEPHTIADIKAVVWRGTAVSDNSVYKAVSKVRDVLGPGVIATRRKLGFQLAATPIAAPPTRFARDTAGRGLGDDGPFVGQAMLLANLARHLDAAQSGHGRVVCLRGEAGAGKTRVATELARLARDAGFEVHWGGLADPEAGAVRHPWLEIAASVRARGDTGEPRTQLYGVPLTATDSGEIAHMTVEVLARAAAVAPRLLVIDDAHWIGEDTARLTLAVGERLASLPVLMLVLVRQPGGLDSAPVERIERIQTLAAETYDVAALTEEDVRTLVRHALGEASAGVLGETISRRADGNAYFTTEMIRWIRDAEGREEPRDALPATIRASIESRLAALPEMAAGMLCYAATIGKELDVAMLRRCGRWTPADLAEAQALFEGEGILSRVDPGDPERLRFEHDLVREVAALGLSGDRRSIHWEIGEIAEELYGNDLTASALVAGHMERGVEVGDPRRAVAALRRAAQASMLTSAHGAAAEHLGSALRIARRSDRPARDLAEILLELGRAQLRTGALAEAARAFQEAARTAEDLGDTTLLGRAALGFSGAAATVGGDHAPSLEMVRRALASLGAGEDTLRSRLLSREALLTSALGRPEDAAHLADRAVALAEVLGDPQTLATAHRVRNTVGVSRVRDADARAAFASATLRLATSAGDVALEVDALMHRGVAELHRGAVHAARRDFKEARGALRGRPLTLDAYPPEVSSVLLAVLDGELALAAERVERAYALGRKVGHTDARLYRDIQRFQLAYLEGSLAELGESGLAQAALKSDLVGVRTVAALMLAEADHVRRVRPMLVRLVEEIAQAPRDTGWLSNTSLLALAASRVADDQAATALRTLLEPYESCVVSAFCVVSNGPVSYFLGLLDALLGNTEHARLRLADAVSQNDAMRIEPWLCLARIALAELTDDDAEEARELARGALRLAQGMGMRSAETRASSLLRRLAGLRRSSPDPSET